MSTTKPVLLINGNPVGDIGGEGGSGGHTIIDSSGTSLPQESGLQFADAFLTDDSVDGRIVVENIKEVDPADYASTTDEGIIVSDNGEDALIGPVSDDIEEVTGNGSKTYATLLNELYIKIDKSKLTPYSKIVMISQYGTMQFDVVFYTNSNIVASQSNASASDLNTDTAILSSASTYYQYRNGSSQDASSTVLNNGGTMTLYYGNKKAVVDLQTTANRCVTSDGETVQSNLNRLNYSSIINTGRLSYTNCTYVDGGYSVIGNVVIVNIRVKVTEDGHIGINNFPRPKTINNKATVGVNVFRIQQDKASQLYAYMLGIDQTTAMITTKDATLTADEEYSFSAVYVSDYVS